MIKKVIFGCDENEDYLQFWNLQRLIWIKKGWIPKLYFIGSQEKYNTLEKEGAEVIRIEPIKGIHTAYIAMMYFTLSYILEKEECICYLSGIDTLLVNDFSFLNIEPDVKEVKYSSICIDSNSTGHSKKINKNYLMGMHFYCLSSTAKNIYYDIEPTKEGVNKFLIKKYPSNFQIRGNGWGKDQEVFNHYINKWKIKQGNKLSFYSMYDSKEAWLYRLASMGHANYDMRDSYNGKIINRNILQYLDNNRHITFLHPYLGHFFGKNKDQCNQKIKEDIIKPLTKRLI